MTNQPIEKEIDEIIGTHPSLIVGTYKGKPILKPETKKLRQALTELVAKMRIQELDWADSLTNDLALRRNIVKRKDHIQELSSNKQGGK